MNQQENQAAENGGGIVDACISSLAEEKRDVDRFGSGSLQFLNKTAYEHGLAFSGIALNPQKPAFVVSIVPLLELLIVQDPAEGVSKQFILGCHDAGLVMARVGYAKRLEALVVGRIGDVLFNSL